MALTTTALSAAWGVPFAGMLLSIALWPLVAPGFWHRHFGKISAAWALAFLLPFAALHGAGDAFALFVHALVDEYIPFIVLPGALYIVAGGMDVRAGLAGRLGGKPGHQSSGKSGNHPFTFSLANTALLASGTLLASIVGTTGASMLLIRPLLRANAHRQYTVHVVVFFIFLVANAGGMLSPLGDPPLFLGFLNGVSFFWTTRHLALPMLFVCGILLAIFYLLDTWYFRRENRNRNRDRKQDETRCKGETCAAFFVSPKNSGNAFGIDGKLNIVWLAGIIGLVLMSGLWRPGIGFAFFGAHVALQNIVRDAGLVVLAVASLVFTPRAVRANNGFDWMPVIEVAKLFAGIFVTIAPVILILRAGDAGAFTGMIHMVNEMNASNASGGQPSGVRYFWVTGALSSFLDNAPTYLAFFNLAGGNAHRLMTDGANTLAAISAGAVLMGANTYIGNAPNFMVKTIAQARGVPMPGFFGYLAWSGAVLLPVFAVAGWLFFA